MNTGCGPSTVPGSVGDDDTDVMGLSFPGATWWAIDGGRAASSARGPGARTSDVTRALLRQEERRPRTGRPPILRCAPSRPSAGPPLDRPNPRPPGRTGVRGPPHWSAWQHRPHLPEQHHPGRTGATRGSRTGPRGRPDAPAVASRPPPSAGARGPTSRRPDPPRRRAGEAARRSERVSRCFYAPEVPVDHPGSDAAGHHDGPARVARRRRPRTPASRGSRRSPGRAGRAAGARGAADRAAARTRRRRSPRRRSPRRPPRRAPSSRSADRPPAARPGAHGPRPPRRAPIRRGRAPGTPVAASRPVWGPPQPAR